LPSIPERGGKIMSRLHLSILAMAFGSPGVAAFGSIYFALAMLVTFLALVFVGARWLVRQIPRRPKPLRPENTCSQELLDYWAKAWPNHTSPNR
jgi:hypothetical protein